MKKILLASVVGAILVGCYDQETRDEMSYLKHPDRAEEILEQCEARFAKAMDKQDSKAIIAIEKDAKCRAAGKVLHELRQMEREQAVQTKSATASKSTESTTLPTVKEVATSSIQESEKESEKLSQSEKELNKPSLMSKAEQEVMLEAQKLVAEAPEISERLMQQDQIFQAHSEGERLAALARNSDQSAKPQEMKNQSEMREEMAEMVAPEIAITETSMPQVEEAHTSSTAQKGEENREAEQLRAVTEHKERLYAEHGNDWQAVMNRYIKSDCAQATGYPTAECVALKDHYHEAMTQGREQLWEQSFSELLGDAAQYCQDANLSKPIKGSSCELWQDMRDEKGKLTLLDLDVFGVEAQYSTFCQNKTSTLCQIWNTVWQDKSAELTAYLSNNDAAFSRTYNRCYQEIVEIDDSSSLRREKIEKEKAIRTSTPCMQAAEAYRNRHLGERAFMHSVEISK
ncbi:hypothetical protein DC083_06275 [Ignatzschineria ureiclastica]|uniref:Uncharacterized protein n=1 Tax=Ignatzschineria ureiclastica TaxID=472582 RepID=A0A2U2ADI0_9GAMM|nr:hypothetical protein [Ignatzschineria ureiclastica]PWD80718.1 hypothetical protein DC083_06275 [Ignatzschineria ureiclastica]GGZ95119.1 hypothetical protein GCM10007162_08970 [Ignatzschineria ureiclastica]